MKKKRVITLWVVVLSISCVFSACSDKKQEEEQKIYYMTPGVDKTELKDRSSEVLERTKYCKKALEKKKDEAALEQFDTLWNGVNEIHGRAYAGNFTQEEMDTAKAQLEDYAAQVDDLYKKNKDVIKKIKKQEAKTKKKK